MKYAATSPNRLEIYDVPQKQKDGEETFETTWNIMNLLLYWTVCRTSSYGNSNFAYPRLNIWIDIFNFVNYGWDVSIGSRVIMTATKFKEVK